MTPDAPTKTNTESPLDTPHTVPINIDEEPIFKNSIPADVPRRQLDRRLLENIDSDHRRVREISNRLTRLESLFEQIHRDISRLEQQQREMLGFQEQTATNMAAIANKLSIHTEMEEYQWTVVNSANTHLEQLSAAFNEHLALAGKFVVRVDWLERVLFGLCGALGTLLLSWISLRMVGS